MAKKEHMPMAKKEPEAHMEHHAEGKKHHKMAVKHKMARHAHEHKHHEHKKSYPRGK